MTTEEKTASATMRRTLKAYCPNCDPEDLDEAVDTLKDVIHESLKRALRGIYGNLKVLKFSGESTDQNSRQYDNGDTYWYSVSYPTHVEIQGAAELPLQPLWAGAPLRKFNLPPLQEPGIIAALTQLIGVLVEDAVPPHPAYLSDDQTDLILTEMDRRRLYEEEISYSDEDGNEYPEAQNLDIHWGFEPPDDVTMHLNLRGTTLQVVAKLQFNIRIRRLSAPGDYEYGRRAAQRIVQAWLA